MSCFLFFSWTVSRSRANITIFFISNTLVEFDRVKLPQNSEVFISEPTHFIRFIKVCIAQREKSLKFITNFMRTLNSTLITDRIRRRYENTLSTRFL